MAREICAGPIFKTLPLGFPEHVHVQLGSLVYTSLRSCFNGLVNRAPLVPVIYQHIPAGWVPLRIPGRSYGRNAETFGELMHHLPNWQRVPWEGMNGVLVEVRSEIEEHRIFSRARYDEYLVQLMNATLAGEKKPEPYKESPRWMRMERLVERFEAARYKTLSYDRFQRSLLSGSKQLKRRHGQTYWAERVDQTPAIDVNTPRG